LTLGNKKVKDVIPANVHGSVKAAQYTAIFIALLMEEDIPTGLYLMQRIPRPYFIEKFPELCHGDFVSSNIMRILMGYLFLLNVLFILMKARDVLQIFFDFVALQFIQQLGDIAFKLARMSMLSTSMKEATTRRYFRTEFRRPTLGWKAKSFFFVAVYLFNLCGLLGGMIYVSVRQSRGDFQCKSITVKFREDIWREATVVSNQDQEDKRVLVYSFFNGVYAQDGSMHDGRPVYIERRKFDGTEAGSGQLWEAYNRPMYRYNLGSGSPLLDGTDMFFLIFSGSRWFGIYYGSEVGEVMFTEEYREPTAYAAKNYHAFWDEVYTQGTIFVSDPVGGIGYTPVGVDFFAIGERGEQFGPFGARTPIQLYNQTGRGYFRCSDEASVDLSIANNTALGAGGRELGRRGG